MSIRAYKIKKIQYENEPTGGLYPCLGWLVSHAGTSVYDRLNQDGAGIVEIEVRGLQKLLKALEAGEVNPQGYDWEGIDRQSTAKAIKKDIKELSEDDFIQYYCL